MDYKVLTQAIGMNEITYEGGVEQQVDSDITLPDYCPDIQRILKCSITPKITGVQTAGDRVTADGAALVKIVYVCENGKVRCFEQNYPFSKFVEMKNIVDSSCVFVRAKTDYANCRAISPRRADVHGMITVTFRALRKKEEKIVCGAEGAGIQLKKQNFCAASVIGDVERAFPMSEVIEIGQSKPPAAQIIRCNAVAVLNDVKVINNKLLLKGELLLNILYCADTKENEIETFDHSMPISQIIELEGITEDCDCDTRLFVTAVDVCPKADSSGEMRLLDISARVCADIHASTRMEIPVVSDAYSTRHELKMDHKTVDFLKLADMMNDAFMAKSALDLSGMGVSSLLDIWCGDPTGTAYVRDDELIVSGTLTVHILYKDKDSQPGYAERQIGFENKRSLKAPITRLICEPTLIVTACGYNMSGENKVDIRVELNVNGAVYSMDSDRLITAMEPNELQEKKSGSSALTIYFPGPGEHVWEIARKYNTTIESVMQENNLASDILDGNAMLLIPGVAKE